MGERQRERERERGREKERERERERDGARETKYGIFYQLSRISKFYSTLFTIKR